MSATRTAVLAKPSRVAAYFALTKPDVSFLVVLTTAAGYYMGSRGPLDLARLVHTTLATALIAAGTSALNQYFERDLDAKMRRTASRPLPSGQLQPFETKWFGVGLAVAGAIYLALVAGVWACLLGVFTSASYLSAYTPLKTRTTWATFVGAFPGAIPPMIGWVAATGPVAAGAGLIFDVVLFYEIAALHAIA